MHHAVQITVSRTASYADRLRDYKIVVDDNVLGTVGAGESAVVHVSEGEHIIEMTIDWCRSNRVAFHATAGQPLRFECGGNLRGWRLLLVLFYVTALSHKYVWLRLATPPA